LRGKIALGQTASKINKRSAMNIDEFSQMVPLFVRPLLALGGPGKNALFVNPNRLCRSDQHANRQSTAMPKNIFQRKSLHQHSIAVILNGSNGNSLLREYSL
jgi:hypothetical protein